MCGWSWEDNVVTKCAFATWRNVDVTKPPWGTGRSIQFLTRNIMIVLNNYQFQCTNRRGNLQDIHEMTVA